MTGENLLITPQEAVKLAQRCTLGDIYIANALCKAMEEDPDYIPEATLAAIWNAGRVQGIREERQKKRRGDSM